MVEDIESDRENGENEKQEREEEKTLLNLYWCWIFPFDFYCWCSLHQFVWLIHDSVMHVYSIFTIFTQFSFFVFEASFSFSLLTSILELPLIFMIPLFEYFLLIVITKIFFFQGVCLWCNWVSNMKYQRSLWIDDLIGNMKKSKWIWIRCSDFFNYFCANYFEQYVVSQEVWLIFLEIGLKSFYQTPLHLAAYQNYKECIEKLLQNGANKSLKNVWIHGKERKRYLECYQVSREVIIRE